ncbi:MAG: hypothetical protein H5U16_00250 [Roseovarius sp.]|nr:hypothetical protein [Roseovarius sp.]
MQRALTLKEHAALVDRMSTAQGVDLETKMMEGLLSPGRLGDAVLACTACTNPGDCAHWLDNHAPGAPAPDYCRNIDLFADLKAGRRA